MYASNLARGYRVPPETRSDKNAVKKRPLRRGQATEATIEEFERENMGIAPKE